MSRYLVRFRALSDEVLPDDAADGLARALSTMPGVDGVERADADAAESTVSAGFWMEARLGMADASRDGSRLAKEALKTAALGDALLVELAVTLERR